MNFGVLRVLNDDRVSESMGFGTHPHKNMEIVSIPLEGDLKHRDNMGNETVIKEGDIQVMSAGTGVMHSEYNNNPDKPVKFLQIWIIPNKQDVEPRYDQVTISENEKPNDFQQILSPNKTDDGVWIYQDAWFHLAQFNQGVIKEYTLKKEGNGVYVFVLEGQAQIGNQILNKRDGLGVENTNAFSIEALEDSRILLMEVPMSLPS
tara:strand:- start:52285 stop:52899 length:615 start_codon:yes stop_codon:yes gene_type:complete